MPGEFIEVRYRTKENGRGSRWRHGALLFIHSPANEPAHAEMIDAKTGGTRFIPLDHVEIKSAGPRGGTVWTKATAS